MTAATWEQLDLFAELEQPVCMDCRHEEDIHYPAWAGTKGCRVFICGCRGWKPGATS